jgi:hypothetical protein
VQYSVTPRGFVKRKGDSLTLILAAGFFSLIPPLYFLRLMSDGRKLRKGLLESQTESGENAGANEELLITQDYSTWKAMNIGSLSSPGGSGRAAIPGRGRLSAGRG